MVVETILESGPPSPVCAIITEKINIELGANKECDRLKMGWAWDRLLTVCCKN